MSVSLLSLKSEESKAIANGRYKCYLNNNANLVVTDGINTWTIAQSDITNLEQQLTAMIETKANSSHTHKISDIYKTITVTNQDQTTTTTTKSLETLMNERDADLRALINGKANSSHTHTISDVTNLQSTLDSLQQAVDAAGDSHNWLDWLNTALNVGEAGALGVTIATIESQISAMEAEIVALQGAQTAMNACGNALSNVSSISDLSDISLESFDEVGNAIDNPLQQSLNKMGDLFNSHSQYMQLGNENIYGSVSNTTNFTSTPTSSLLITPEIL